MIKMEPAPLAPDEFLLNVWLYEDDQYQSVYVSETSQNLAELQVEIGKIVHACHQKLRQPFAEVGLEFLLPTELLNCDLDTWRIPVGRRSRSLGSRYEVVVRSLNRIYDSDYKPVWSTWKKKWQDCPSPPAVVTDSGVYWASPDQDGDDQLYNALERTPYIFVAQGTWSAGSSAVHDVIETILDSGIPIALWFRHAADATATAVDVDPVQLRDLVYQSPLRELPQRILNKRKDAVATATPESLWQQVVLLWDDPERLPPDVAFNLQTPET